MARTAAVLATCLSALSATAAVSHPRSIIGEIAPSKLGISLSKPTKAVPPPAEARVTDETRVMLNGKTCQFSEVPANATIAYIEIARDGRTIVKIEFQAGK